jgi:hypothetical protein
MAAKTPTKPPAMVEDSWREARLLPTTGIGGQDEQELRATSSLLAVMRAVPEFGRALLTLAGAPPGRIRTFMEVRLPTEDAKMSRPDGAMIVERGKTRWVALLEVKTGGVPLRADQINGYLELARANAFDAVLTISNQITTTPAESPVAVDGRRLKKVDLRHLSWWNVVTEARLQRDFRGITDPDQAWILGELIAYLENERAGAAGFEDMGDKWVGVRDAARQMTLRTTDAGVNDVASRWEQFVQFLALGLRQDLGRNVVAVLPKGLDPTERRDANVKRLAETGTLEASIRVPDAVAPVEIVADLRMRRLTTSVELLAPREGRPKTKVAWLLRQLAEAPDSIRLEARFANTKQSTSILLKEVREQPEKLLLSNDPKREPRSFVIALSKDLGQKRGKGAGSFVQETQQQAVDFYRIVVQRLRPWSAVPPKLPQPAPVLEVGIETVVREDLADLADVIQVGD